MHPKGKVIALCDNNILGKNFEHKGFCIDLDKHKHFYDGEIVQAFVIKTILDAQDYSSVNAVGEETVAFLVSHGFVSKDEIKHIAGIPIVHIYKL